MRASAQEFEEFGGDYVANWSPKYLALRDAHAMVAPSSPA